MKLAFPPFAVLALLAAGSGESAKSRHYEDYAQRAVASAPASPDTTLCAAGTTSSRPERVDPCTER